MLVMVLRWQRVPRRRHHLPAASFASVYAGPVRNISRLVVFVELINRRLLLKMLAVLVPRHIFLFLGDRTPGFGFNMAEGGGIEPQSRARIFAGYRSARSTSSAPSARKNEATTAHVRTVRQRSNWREPSELLAPLTVGAVISGAYSSYHRVPARRQPHNM